MARKDKSTTDIMARHGLILAYISVIFSGILLIVVGAEVISYCVTLLTTGTASFGIGWGAKTTKGLVTKNSQDRNSSSGREQE